MAVEPGIIKTADNTQKMLDAIQRLTTADVLVGVPADKTARTDGPTNAMLAYVHEFGSPARRIPPRPFLYPGIRNATQQITDTMARGGREALAGNTDAVERTLNQVGILARNSVVRAITDPSPPFVPLKPATVRARLRKTQAGRRQLKSIQDKARKAGGSFQQALADWGAAGNIKPLLDTLQLRNSISYVIRQGEEAPRAWKGGRLSTATVMTWRTT